MKEKDIPAFKRWLERGGCEILPPTNPYELLRFKGKNVGVVYTTGRTNSPYTNGAIIAYQTRGKWNGFPVSTGRDKSYRQAKLKLLERDGDLCFYCNEKLGQDITVEHLIPLTAGGKNELSNMVLAHYKCNNEQGTKTIVEKVKYAIDKQLQKLKILHNLKR